MYPSTRLWLCLVWGWGLSRVIVVQASWLGWLCTTVHLDLLLATGVGFGQVGLERFEIRTARFDATAE